METGGCRNGNLPPSYCQWKAQSEQFVSVWVFLSCLPPISVYNLACLSMHEQEVYHLGQGHQDGPKMMDLAEDQLGSVRMLVASKEQWGETASVTSLEGALWQVSLS